MGGTGMKRKAVKRAELPPPCRECRPLDGAWRRDVNGGLERCDCPRGDVLAGRVPREKPPRKPGHDGKQAATGE